MSTATGGTDIGGGEGLRISHFGKAEGRAVGNWHTACKPSGRRLHVPTQFLPPRRHCLVLDKW